MIFHVDGNSFYASCERLFRPDLYGKPIAVLSNNDGIVVALDQYCKDLGFRRGDVYFKVRKNIEEKGVAVFSSNYTLYADISGRLNAVYSRFCPDVELYSIDESFLYFPEWRNAVYRDIGREVRETAGRETGVPVSVGIAPTKTLAKLCNKLAKKHGGVFEWSGIDGDAVLKNYPAGDVWGIGRSKAALLKKQGVVTAFDLKKYPLNMAKKHLSITGVRTVQELNGITAVDRAIREKRDQIMCSRSFSGGAYHLDELITALSEHTREAVKRLREDALECSFVSVFIMTNAFAGGEQYCGQDTARFQKPTAYLPEVQTTAAGLLRRVYRHGYKYRKVMVLLSGMEDAKKPQQDLFEDTSGAEKRERLMKCFDTVNDKYGRGTLKLGVSGTSQKPEGGDYAPWEMRREFLSPAYTTRLQDVPKVF